MSAEEGAAAVDGITSSTADGPAAGRWRADLAAWAIPPEILAAAPASPWECPPALFGAIADAAVAGAARLSTRRALEALPLRGVVLDVGVGGGAASLPLCPPAARVVGVDQSASMLGAFAARADARGVESDTICGLWPAVADAAPVADAVVCNHVLYNVGELAPFVHALSAHARRRVVVEISAVHPQASLNPLWERFWNVIRPTRPSAADAAAVIAEAGYHVTVERGPAPSWTGDPGDPAVVAFACRRLCLPAVREPEVAAALAGTWDDAAAREAVVLWWPGTAPSRSSSPWSS